MFLRFSYSSRHGLALGVRWLVLAVFMFGTIVSSIGGTSSHGIAAITTVRHVAPFSFEESHEHAHDNEGSGAVNQSKGADHPHHGADHSHDSAHALPTAWSTAAAQLPVWLGIVLPWSEMIQAARLERPPKS